MIKQVITGTTWPLRTPSPALLDSQPPRFTWGPIASPGRPRGPGGPHGCTASGEWRWMNPTVVPWLGIHAVPQRWQGGDSPRAPVPWAGIRRTSCGRREHP